MCAPRIERVLRRILDAFQLRDPILDVLPLLLCNLKAVEFLLQLLAEAGRLFLRFESRAIDGPVAGHATIDARDVHVVDVDEEIGKDDLIDLEGRIDEVEHRQVQDQIRTGELHGLQLLVEKIDRGGELFALVLLRLDLAQPDIHARLRRVALARHVLQTEHQVVEVPVLSLVLGELPRPVGTLLHHRRLRDVALRVQPGLGEAEVLIGRVVLSLPAIEVLLGQNVLIAMAGDVHFVFPHPSIEVGQLRLVRFQLRRAQITLDPLLLHAHELALEPLPAADVVVSHDQAGGHQQPDAGEGEDEIQPSHRVVVGNGFLGLHRSWFAARGPRSAALRENVPANHEQRTTNDGFIY